MRVVVSDTAKAELARQIATIRSLDPEAARRQKARISQAVARLRDFPRMGKPGRIEGTRELVIANTPFLIVYDENPTRIEILHILHGRQNWPEEASE